MNTSKPRTRKRPSIHVDCHVAKPSIEEQLEGLDPWNPIDRFMMALIYEGELISEKVAKTLVDAICETIVDDLRTTCRSQSPLGTISLSPNESTWNIVFIPDNYAWLTGCVRSGDDVVTKFANRVSDRIRPTVDIEPDRVAKYISMYLFSVYEIINLGTDPHRCMIGTSEDIKLGDAYAAAFGECRCEIAIDFSPKLLDRLIGQKRPDVAVHDDRPKDSTEAPEDSDKFCPWANISGYRFEKIVLDYVIEHLARNDMSWVPIGKVVWLKSYHHKRAITTENCYIDMVNDGYIANPMFQSLRGLIVPMYVSGEKHVESLMNAYATAIHRWWDKHDIAPIDRINWLVDRWKYVNGLINGTKDDKEDAE